MLPESDANRTHVDRTRPWSSAQTPCSEGQSHTFEPRNFGLEGAQLDQQQAEAVGLLGVIAGQDVEPGEQPGTFKIASKVAPDRVISVVDPDARHMHKTSAARRDGYKMECGGPPRRSRSRLL
jgi:hypothetical protein